MSSLAESDDAVRRRIRQLEDRLDALLAELDAARGEMADAAVDPATLAEIERLRRELQELRPKRPAS